MHKSRRVSSFSRWASWCIGRIFASDQFSYDRNSRKYDRYDRYNQIYIAIKNNMIFLISILNNMISNIITPLKSNLIVEFISLIDSQRLTLIGCFSSHSVLRIKKYHSTFQKKSLMIRLIFVIFWVTVISSTGNIFSTIISNAACIFLCVHFRELTYNYMINFPTECVRRVARRRGNPRDLFAIDWYTDKSVSDHREPRR